MTELIKYLKKRNPYPEEIFKIPSSETFDKIHKCIKNHGLYPDGYNGWFGRHVWNNCIKVIEMWQEEIGIEMTDKELISKMEIKWLEKKHDNYFDCAIAVMKDQGIIKKSVLEKDNDFSEISKKAIDEIKENNNDKFFRNII